MPEWVGEIRFEPEVAEKLRTKHNLTPAQVREAVACGAHEEARWVEHPKYGRRLMLLGADAESRMLVYLKPLDQADGLWQCRTAWRI